MECRLNPIYTGVLRRNTYSHGREYRGSGQTKTRTGLINLLGKIFGETEDASRKGRDVARAICSRDGSDSNCCLQLGSCREDSEHGLDAADINGTKVKERERTFSKGIEFIRLIDNYLTRIYQSDKLAIVTLNVSMAQTIDHFKARLHRSA